jgi:hypothetical protein
MDVGVWVRPRDAETPDDLGVVRAPAPVLPGDVLADAADVFRVEAVLVVPPGTRWVPVLVRREE